MTNFLLALLQGIEEYNDPGVKDKAWTRFIKAFPNADVTKFVSQVSIDDKNNFTAEVFFKASPELLQSVFGSDRLYWSKQMKSALSWLA